MIYLIKKIAHSIVPGFVFRTYHGVLTSTAAWFYGFPSRKLIVIAVTGTNGKSTSCILIADLLKAAGQKVGLASSVLFRVGDREWKNTAKMTMVGRSQLQSLLSDMVKEGCTYAVIEASSEGLAQGRLRGIDVDVALFTNLTPEHIESHGSFEKYKKAKALLFTSLERSYRKVIGDTMIPKIIVANTDDVNSGYYMNVEVDRVSGFGINKPTASHLDTWHPISDVKIDHTGAQFSLNQIRVQTCLEGLFNVYNSASALAVVYELGFSIESLRDALLTIPRIPGRMEWIDQGQDYKVLVDYAPEPASLQAVYSYLQDQYKDIKTGRIIHVLGSAGGGRDMARRPILGKMAGEFADVVIITNEDPYDEDPKRIMEHVKAGAIAAGKIEGQDLLVIQDRQEAINTACSMAKAGDIVLLTGKGAEQAIMGASGTSIPWDERENARKAIAATLKTS